MIKRLDDSAEILGSMSTVLLRMWDAENRTLPPLDNSSAGNLESLAFWLRAYARSLEFAGQLRTKRETPIDLCKYSLVSYVETKTKREHHREVASLIAVGLKDVEYNEASHKMWCSRNFDRLQKAYPELPLYLSAFSILLSPDSNS
jgi:hypothetical protein